MLKKIIFIALYGLMATFYLSNSYAKSERKLSSIAFYYGHTLPANELQAFDIAVVMPNKSIDPKQYNSKNSELFAYVNTGETDNEAPYLSLPKQCIIGRNKAWKANIVDQRESACRSYYLHNIIKPLWSSGYKGIFLDTLDSYQLTLKSKQQQAAYVNGLVKLIQQIKQHFPQIKIILNRGFELLPQIHGDVYAVAAESLFRGWNQASKKYVAVSQNDRTWLMNKFKEARKYGLPAISIDYLPLSATKQQQRNLAKKISALGVIPWVTDNDLQSLGMGNTEVIPRKILVFYDSKSSESLMTSSSQTYAAMPMNYMGYVFIFRNVHDFYPSNQALKGKYAGILVWLESNYLEQHSKFQNWLSRQVKQHIPLVLMGGIRADLLASFKKTLGININAAASSPTKVHITKQTKMIGYEIKPNPSPYVFTPITVKDSNVQLQVTGNNKLKSDVVAITPWGGYAENPFITVDLPNEQTRWVINPFEFFRKAFRLPLMPVPDVTTENGRRLMLVHVDGDGFVSKGEWYKGGFAGEILLKQILEKYKIPTDISIIQAELAKGGLYAQYSTQLEEIARAIYQLPWVEIASHSYSHPYKWQELASMADKSAAKNKDYYMPVKNYTFNIQAEITGSMNYINKNLAPAGKRCQVFLWTGDCDPANSAVTLTYKDGLRNMNGGDTTITYANNSLTNIAALGLYKGKYFQIYAPNQNENIYTNLWTGPFYGYRKAVETFKMTDKPIRYKPIDIYYHFYSATKKASLAALRYVYDWALKQHVFNIYASEYVDKVLDFNRLVLARQGSNWLIRNSGALRELRLPQNMYPDLQKSSNIIGFRKINNSNYIHLGPQTSTMLTTQSKPLQAPYLADANAKIIKYQRIDDNKIFFALSGHLPIQLGFANMDGYSLTCNGKNVSGGPVNARVTLYALGKGTTAATCAVQRNSQKNMGT